MEGSGQALWARLRIRVSAEVRRCQLCSVKRSPTQLLGGDGPEWVRVVQEPWVLAEVHPAMGNLPRLFPTCVSRRGSWDVNQETCQRAWQMMVSQEIPASSFLLPRYRARTCCRSTPAPSLEPQQAKLPL